MRQIENMEEKKKMEEMMTLMEKFEDNLRFIKEAADYILDDNMQVLPMIIEQVAKRNNEKPVDFLKDLLEQMKRVHEELGDADIIE